MRFFETCCGVKKEKIKIQLMLPPNTNRENSMKYWSSITSIPLSQIHPTIIVSRSSKSVRPKDRLPHGTIHLRIHDVKLFFTIIGWIEGLQQKMSAFR